ncbi:hypothetical protein CTEN210_09669 [Chaetoceros tenuissimus]|uniref:Uncharacterized protein n=1 Tax=Chaetoceros tenuissimus TaxID=426638 RepID=A0AAD3H7U0_9STRA|nr:hypothetical protein CTEN210_09669 [Chaetoceros tenuissimus]
MSTSKRMKLKHESCTVGSTVTMNDLPSEVMKNIFNFVGKGNYCLIAPVSKDFCYNYLTTDVIEDSSSHKLDHILAIQKNMVTTPEAVCSCKDLAEHCFLNAVDCFQEDLLAKAAEKGRRDLVTMGHALGVDMEKSFRKLHPIAEIAKKGDLEMLKLLHEKGLDVSTCSKTILENAAFHGHLDILKWMESLEGSSIESEYRSLFGKAAEGGHLDIIQWGQDIAVDAFQTHKYSCMIDAAFGGQLELVQWLRTQGAVWDFFTLHKAASTGSIPLIEYLLQNGCESRFGEICEVAAEFHDDTNLLELLRQYNVPWDERTCAAAAQKGNINVLMYARLNGCPWDGATLYNAVINGHIDVVEYCLNNGCPVEKNICSVAMMHSMRNCARALEVLKLLRKFSLQWDKETCENAAKNGNLEALKWARSLGCPWDSCTMYHAVESRDITLIKYCIDNCPRNFMPGDICSRAIFWNTEDVSISILKLLHDGGFRLHEDQCAVAAKRWGSFKVLRWLKLHSCPWDERVCITAVKYDNFELLVYAHENQCPWSEETFAYCFDNDYGLEGIFDEIPTEVQCSGNIFKYLVDNGCPQPRPEQWILNDDH